MIRADRARRWHAVVPRCWHWSTSYTAQGSKCVRRWRQPVERSAECPVRVAAAAALCSPAAFAEQRWSSRLLYHSEANPIPTVLSALQVATERLDAHKMRSNVMALERPSSLKMSSSQPELRQRKVARERGVTAAVTRTPPPLTGAGPTSVAAAAVMHAAHATHTARYAVAVRRRAAWDPPSPEGLHNRIPPPSTLTSFQTSPPSNGAPSPVAFSPSAPCLSRRGGLPPLWRPERPSPWQGARYGEPLPSKQTLKEKMLRLLLSGFGNATRNAAET